ncbi:hypothetical protein HaLaN_25562 [Haematococcus lacustris]|uniref:Uncharacterized protein n=1 Tax=Haematococcus lacustris TaxID=44745 RepID=A0A6A0A3M7_HAELA|nr:hypothetical protein HaLaN_25562 [Haematococcus lacustris]
MQSREAVKEALRILCERLTMTCLLREAQLSHGSLRQYADKVDLLVKTQQQRSQQPGTVAAAPLPTAAKQVPCTGTQPSSTAAAAAAAAAAGANKAAAAAQQQAQLSPVDSVTSCQEQVALAQSAAPMPRPVQINVSVELGAFQGKLLQG